MSLLVTCCLPLQQKDPSHRAPVEAAPKSRYRPGGYTSAQIVTEDVSLRLCAPTNREDLPSIQTTQRPRSLLSKCTCDDCDGAGCRKAKIPLCHLAMCQKNTFIWELYRYYILSYVSESLSYSMMNWRGFPHVLVHHRASHTLRSL
jgi:hypothetical protein